MSILVLICALVLNFFIAKEFQNIAYEKNANDIKYFWWCFWLGIVGWLMVIALPNNNNGSSNIENTELPEI